MFSPRNAILLTVLALALAVPGHVAAQAGPTITWADFTYADVWLDDPCYEDIGYGYFMSGLVRIRTMSHTTPSGNVHLSFKVRPVDLIAEDAYWYWQLFPGFGPIRNVTALTLGQTWTVHGTFQTVENILPPLGGTFTFTSNLALVGPGPTHTLHTHWHVTVNANGEITVDMLDSWATGCQ